MGMLELFRKVGMGFRIGMEHSAFCQFVEKGRDEACQALTYIVENQTPEKLFEFEQWFLGHSIIVVGNTRRLRAMELYAFLKMQETIHYQTFRGFDSEAGPLAA